MSQSTTNAVEPNDAADSICEPLLEWIELLKHPKTVTVATSCLVYIGNALAERRECDIKATVTRNSPYTAHDRRAAYIGNSTVVLGRTTQINLTQLDKKDANHITDYYKSENHSADQYAKILAEFINQISEIEYDSKSCMPDFNIFRVITRWIHGRGRKNTAWKDIRRSDSTNESIKMFTKFLLKKSNSACTQPIVQLILDTIIYFETRICLRGYSGFLLLSPLYEATKAQDLDALIMLLSHKFGTGDYQQRDSNSHTPLFYAVKLDYPIIAKTLIIFGAADRSNIPDLENIKKLLSAKPELSKEMRDIVEKLIDEEKIDEGDRWNVPTRLEFERMTKKREFGGKVTHLLSLDGGGIRGLVLTTVLRELEKMKVPIYKFGFIAGTSTGAILALAIADGKSISECRDIYFKFKDVVFTPAEKDYLNYDTKCLEKFLGKTFKKAAVTPSMFHLGEQSGMKIIATSVEGEGKKLQLALFKSYSIHPNYEHFNLVSDNVCVPGEDDYPKPPPLCEPENGIFRECNKLVPNPIKSSIVDAARATSAAPSYFEPHRIDLPEYHNHNCNPDDCSKHFASYIDGGVKNNNPTTLLVKEYEKYKEAIECYNDEVKKYGKEDVEPEEHLNLGAVLSIGTGMMIEKEDENEAEVVKCFSGRFREFKQMIRLFFKFADQITVSDGDPVELSKSYTKVNRGVFFRITPTFTYHKKDKKYTFNKKIGLDETDNKILIEMMWRTKIFMRSQVDYVTNLTKTLNCEPPPQH